jgi:DNA-binding response OmpR family regulator
MAKKVLVVDDEKLIVKGIRFSLEQDGMEVDCAYDGQEALDLATANQYDMILLDVMLPKLDGFEVCQSIREFSNVPIVMLTAKGDDMDKILGLEYGADDYITKPFSMEELVYRMEAILRRVHGKQQKNVAVYHIGRFIFDTRRQILTIDDKQTKLTTKESELLILLCAHANDVLQRELALKTIWIDDNYFNARSMDVYITKLRKHLKDDPDIEINNVHGKGYRLIAHMEEE